MPFFQHANSSTVLSIAQESAAAEVSWQSIFWAPVPIALNSMIQPCGSSTPSMPPGLGFPLRVSPVFCLCNALLLLSQLIKHAGRTKSAQEALSMVARKRYLSPRSCSERPSSGPEALQENYVFRASGFVLGALPQAIKLYGCVGLLWTKVWVSMLLLSFAVLEIFVTLVMHRESEIAENVEEVLPSDLEEVSPKGSRLESL